jgi:hypothetical protein
MKEFEVTFQNAEGQVGKNLGRFTEKNLSLAIGKQFAETIINQSRMSDFWFELTMKSDTTIWTIKRIE